MTERKQIAYLLEAKLSITEAVLSLTAGGDAGQAVHLLCNAMKHISHVLSEVTDTSS